MFGPGRPRAGRRGGHGSRVPCPGFYRESVTFAVPGSLFGLYTGLLAGSGGRDRTEETGVNKSDVRGGGL